MTWEFGGEVSWVQLRLSEADGGTTLERAHEAHVDPDFWAQFGPGAVGVGWDLALFGLDEHLAGAGRSTRPWRLPGRPATTALASCGWPDRPR